MVKEMEIYEDRLGKIHVDIDEKRDWIFFQRERGKPEEPVVFYGMELSVLKKILEAKQ